MRSIQATAIILWVIIFVIAAFILGQFLSSKGILDITAFITGNKNEEQTKEDKENTASDELQNDIIISKVGQETVRIGQNIAMDYFASYYKEYINYIMQNGELYEGKSKVAITNDLASDYVFFALANQVDQAKYVANSSGNTLTITEGNVNSFVDKMFAKTISEKYKTSAKGYERKTKEYNIERSSENIDCMQELTLIENVTSNQMKLSFDCKKMEIEDKKQVIKEIKQINLYVVYRGGRYIVTDVEKLEK